MTADQIIQCGCRAMVMPDIIAIDGRHPAPARRYNGDHNISPFATPPHLLDHVSAPPIFAVEIMGKERVRRNSFLHTAGTDEPATLAGTLTDILSGIAMMAFIIGTTLFLAGIAG